MNYNKMSEEQLQEVVRKIDSKIDILNNELMELQKEKANVKNILLSKSDSYRISIRIAKEQWNDAILKLGNGKFFQYVKNCCFVPILNVPLDTKNAGFVSEHIIRGAISSNKELYDNFRDSGYQIPIFIPHYSNFDFYCFLGDVISSNEYAVFYYCLNNGRIYIPYSDDSGEGLAFVPNDVIKELSELYEKVKDFMDSNVFI